MERLFKKKLVPVHKISVGDIQFQKRQDVHNIILLVIFTGAIVVSFIFLIARLFQLTVVRGALYLRLSEENRVKELLIEPKRGTITDRKGYVLAENKAVNPDSKGERIGSPRIYMAHEESAHLLGYRQIANKDDIKNDMCLQKIKLGDKIGKKGVEKLYDCDLRGISGKKMIEVDAHGSYMKTLAVLPPVDGKTIQLAIDEELQQKAYGLLNGRKGAIVAIKPSTGEILVFVSSPSFDPQKFEDGDTAVEEYLTDTSKPLFDRITEAAYPPGSLFKLFVATGALEENKVDEKTTVEDTGRIQAGPITFGNWYFLQYGKTEGQVNMVKAIQRSNDIYFYKVGEKLGAEGIKKWAGVFGLGKETGIGFEEQEGLIPSPFWKVETLHEQWYLGDTYNMAIGQGYTLIPPIQVARAVLPFATNGVMCNPVFQKNEKSVCKRISVSRGTFDLIREGMKEACSPGGTGWPLFNFTVRNQEARIDRLKDIPDDKKASIEAALDKDPHYMRQIQTGCKTGTAESTSQDGMAHAWFSAFAPFDNPEIAVTVLIEEGGQGSDVAGPVVKEILKAYFERKE